MSTFRKSFPTNIHEIALNGNWVKVLDLMDVPRLGDLQASAAFNIEVAYSGTPAAYEIVTITAEPVEFMLPRYKELWARVAGGGGGGVGPAELHGSLYYE